MGHSRLRAVALVAVIIGIASLLMAAPVDGQTGDPTTGVLIALDTNSGQEIWRTSTPPIFSIEDVSDRVVAGRGYGCYGGPFRTFAARTRDGKKLWQAPAGDSAPSSRGGDTLATGSGSSGVVVSTTAKNVRGLDAVSGQERWSVPVAHVPQVSAGAKTVVIAEPNTAFRGRVKGVARATDRATGKQMWSVSVADADMATAVVGPGSVAVAFRRQVVSGLDVSLTADARVLDLRSGAERWNTDDLAPVLVTDSVIVMQRGDRGAIGLVVLDAATGEQLWERSSGVPQRIWSMGSRLGMHEVQPVRPSDGTNRFSVVDARTGAPAWDRPTAESELPVAASQSGVVLADRTTVTVVDANTGATRWQSAPLATGTFVNSAALAGDRLYLAAGCSYSD